MATSKAKKTTAKKTTAAKGKVIADKAASKVAPEATVKASTADKKAAPSVTLDTKNEAVKKDPVKPAVKPKAKDAEKKDEKKPDLKKEVKPKKAEKVQKSGRGMAFLALLFSFGALALSGFNLYESKFAPGAVKPAVIIDGVNDIGSNVSAMGDVVATLKTEVQELSSQQSSFVNTEVLESLVTEKVGKQVASIVEQAGEQPIADNLKAADTSVLEELSNKVEVLKSENSAESKSAVETVPANEIEDVAGVELGAAAVSSELEVAEKNEPQEPVELWSWERAKADFYSMFDFISIRKLDNSKD